jgi:hypothetical protein
MRHEHGDALIVPARSTQATRASDRDICDAYLYLLGRLLVLRQEHFDLLAGCRWNRLVHRDATSGRDQANPELACSEAWVAVDETSYTIIDVPRIAGRYYTVQVINLWGETIANINERTFPDHPSGAFALCLRGARLALPHDVRRIDLTGRKARVAVRIELGADPQLAIELQQQIAMRASGRPLIQATVGIPLFTNDRLPGVEAFDTAAAVLESEQDVNPGTEVLQAKVRGIAALARDPGERARIDRIIRERSWGLRQTLYQTEREWVLARSAGTYGADWLGRTAANLLGIWSNSKTELVCFKAGTMNPLIGDHAYTLTFSRDNLPQRHVGYFWSLGAVTSATLHAPAEPGHRAVLTSHVDLRPDPDGGLTLYLAPRLPRGAPEPNWLATPTGRGYTLVWKGYGPDPAIATGRWFPPALQRLASAT